jgi:glycosyltransferase involved in cell wall biosynthesis
VNILLINQYAGSPHHGMEFRPYLFAREWIKSHHRVRIVAGSFVHTRTTNPKVHRGWLSIDKIDGLDYCWVKTIRYAGNGVLRAVNIFQFVCLLFFFRGRLLRKFKPDLVIASSTHPLDIFPAFWYAKSSSAKLVFEVHDLWPLSPIELGGMSKYNPFIVLLQCAENFAYRHSDVVVSLLPSAKQHMIDHGMAESKFRHIPNGIDLEEWEENETDGVEYHVALLDKLRREKQILVGYAGAFGIANALHCLIHAAKEVESEPIEFVLIGDGPERAKLVNAANGLGLQKIHFLAKAPKASIPNLLGKMDILYIGLQDQPLFRFGISPNKMFDYMMAGKPIIQAINTPTNIVVEAQCGVVTKAESSHDVVEAIRFLSRLSNSDRTEMGLHGRQFVSTHHTYSVLAARFLDSLSQEER